MSDLPNNIAVLTHLKDKVHKWKNIAILAFVIAVLLVLHMMSGDDLSGLEDGDYIANIKVEGMILEDDHRSKVLAEIAKEDSIKAVIVNINSPGGGIVGSEILYEDLKKIAAKKPIVVLMGAVAASGGYMAAVAADYIIAHNGTLTGSVGVLMQSAEFTNLADKMGIKFNTYKSAPLKASPSPFEKTNANIDRAVQESIKDSAEFFFELVKKRRGLRLVKSETDKIFDGRVFTGRQALKAGLIDEIGSKDRALAYLKNKNVDVKLEMHDISLEKEKTDFLEKFMGYLPFSKNSKMFDASSGIMAVMPM